MLKETPVKIVKADLICDECGEIMVNDGVMLSSNPPQFPHTCPKCEYKLTTLCRYPNIEYKDNDNSN